MTLKVKVICCKCISTIYTSFEGASYLIVTFISLTIKRQVIINWGKNWIKRIVPYGILAGVVFSNVTTTRCGLTCTKLGHVSVS